jgi:ferredoxin
MSTRIVTVDRILCDGFGTCAQLLPERITLDEWGYPVIDPAPLGHAERGHAKRAVNACPRLALSLVTGPRPAPATPGARR